MIPWLPGPGMRTVQMHENLFIWNKKWSNIYTALSSIVPAKLIDTPFIYCFFLITHCDFQSTWCFFVSLFVLLGHGCQNLFVSCCYLLVKIIPHSYIWILCDQEKGGEHVFLVVWILTCVTYDGGLTFSLLGSEQLFVLWVDFLVVL